MENNVAVSFITVNFNGISDTIELIKSLQENLHRGDYEIVVVDNASVKDEAAQIKELFPSVKTIRSNKNLGFAGGNNLGVGIASGDALFFINNDTYINGDILTPLLDRLYSSDNIGAVSPKIKFAWDSNPIQFAGYTKLSSITLRNSLIGFMEEDTGKYEKAMITPYIHGAAFIVKKSVIEKAGLMPELFFLYYEELDFSQRISDAGYQMWYEPKSLVFHKESKSTGRISPLKSYYMTRNRLVFAYRNLNGLNRILSVIYQITIAVPKQILVYLLHGKLSLAGACIKGVSGFFINCKKWKL